MDAGMEDLVERLARGNVTISVFLLLAVTDGRDR
jgi:hypothetical protein